MTADRVSCAELAGDLLADYHDDLLPQDRKGAVEAHVAVCRSCMNMVRSYCATTKIAKACWSDTPSHCEKSLLEYLKRHGAL
jgi:hypothetical protein